MQNIQRSLVDRRSLNGLQVIRLHYNTADDIQKYMTVIRESIKVIEIGLLSAKKFKTKQHGLLNCSIIIEASRIIEYVTLALNSKTATLYSL